MRKKLTRIIATALLMLLLPVLALAADFAVVTGGRLNLRQAPTTDSQSLGKYASGSWVEIRGTEYHGFYPVKTMDGKMGYMSSGYLKGAVNSSSATVKYANGGYVNLRSGPSLEYSVVQRVTSGTQVTIQDDSYEWNYIRVRANGRDVYGYMHDSFLDRGTSTAYVTTRNGGKVNVRSGPDSDYSSVGKLASGTQVKVLLKGNGWYHVSASGMTGFMSTEYLSDSSNPGGGSSPSTGIAYVNNPKSTQVLNLREYASQSARSIGQYRNGTQVRVVAYDKTWCEVYVGTKHGYMMTRYLSFNGSYVKPSYTQAPSYVYPVYPVTTPTPLVQYITPRPTAAPTPQVTMQPSYDVSNTPSAGMYAWLAIAAGGSSSNINVYANPQLTQVKATYQPGQQVMILSYGPQVSLILVGGQTAYVSTWNLNY